MKRQPHHGKHKEIDLWKRTATKINPSGGEEERRVREQLEAYIKRLNEDLAAAPEDDSVKTVDIAELEEKVSIPPLSLSLTLSLSFLHVSCSSTNSRFSLIVPNP